MTRRVAIVLGGLAGGGMAWALASVAVAASPEGLWRTPAHHGQVEITHCGEALCGRVVTSDVIEANPAQADIRNKDPARRGRLLKDMVVISGFTGGPVEWKGGEAYNPEDGGTYKGSIRLEGPDTLKLTGCIIFPLCKTQTWTRIR